MLYSSKFYTSHTGLGDIVWRGEGVRVTTTGFYDCDYVILVYNFISKRDSNAVQNIRQIIAE